MKYFFLTDGWHIGRVWELGGLWNEMAWGRKPQLERMDLCVLEKGEKMWLYRVEDGVLMVEVKPPDPAPGEVTSNIGQVVLKRLITAEQALDFLCTGDVSLVQQG